MTDRIALHGLRVNCVVGVHAWERKAPRDLLLDVILERDLTRAARSDDLADTVDYDALARALRQRIAERAPRLIEAVAAAAAECCLTQQGVVAVEVTVHKPGAVEGTSDVAVHVRRERASSRRARVSSPRAAPRRASRPKKRAR